jgi:hypothetical protein
VIEDFNEALWQHEHLSIFPRQENQMAAFRDALMIYGLKDLGFTELTFTFDNQKSGGNNVQVRLDRAVADDRWRNIFTDASVVHLVSPCSDHAPILVQLNQKTRMPQGRRCLRYEILWERDHALPEVIKNAWTGLGTKSDMGDVHAALEQEMNILHKWGGKKFGNVMHQLTQLSRKLGNLMACDTSREEIRETMDMMNELLYREEMLWLQRSHSMWLKGGGRALCG